MRFRRRTSLALLSAATLAIVTITGCSTQHTDRVDAQQLTIVASTNVYASIAKTIAGEHANVVALIDSPTADPHSFEPTPSDIASLHDADIVVVNGGGYDQFALSAVKDVPKERIINAYSFLSGDHDTTLVAPTPDDHDDTHHHHHGEGAGNEHVFYNLDVTLDVATELAHKLTNLKPLHKATFQRNLNTFATGINSVKTVLDTIGKERPGARYLQTEPLAGYLADEADLINVTPEGYAEATEEGSDVPARLVAQMRTLIEQKQADVLFFNTQNSSTTTMEARNLAQHTGLPVVALTETLPQGKDYITWMLDNANALKAALNIT